MSQVSQVNQLRGMVATMLRLPPDQVSPETSLADLDSSLGGAKLKLGLKRLGLSLTTASSPGTFGELEAALFEKLLPKAQPASSTGEVGAPMVRTHAASAGVQVGIDVQDVRSLPVTGDYWEHEFYAGMFGKSEIAYAAVQSEPRTHFAGFWCAKEALRKCDPTFTKVGFESTVVAHEQDGRPYMLWRTASGPIRLPHSLSLSHTGDLATAVVISIAFPLGSESSRKEAPAQPAAKPVKSSGPAGQRRLPGILGSVALLVVGAIVALLIRYFL